MQRADNKVKLFIRKYLIGNFDRLKRLTKLCAADKFDPAFKLLRKDVYRFNAVVMILAAIVHYDVIMIRRLAVNAVMLGFKPGIALTMIGQRPGSQSTLYRFLRKLYRLVLSIGRKPAMCVAVYKSFQHTITPVSSQTAF